MEGKYMIPLLDEGLADGVGCFALGGDRMAPAPAIPRRVGGNRPSLRPVYRTWGSIQIRPVLGIPVGLRPRPLYARLRNANIRRKVPGQFALGRASLFGGPGFP